MTERNELAELCQELLLGKMKALHLIEPSGDGWSLTEDGWDWLCMLEKIRDRESAEFARLVSQERRRRQ
jgi:hypothetical protein